MAVDNFIYQGINRAVSDYAGTRFCEELINLRPVQGGLVPVRDFAVKFANTSFYKVFVHHTTDGDKYLALWKDDDALKLSLINEDDGTVGQDLFNTPWDTPESVEAVHFAAAGNVFLISMCDTYNEVYKTKAYIWKMDDSLSTPAMAYVEMEADAPSVSVTIGSGGEVLASANQDVPYYGDAPDADVLRSDIENALNAIQENNPELCLGPVVIAVAFKTKDAKTFWTGNWMVYDPVAKVDTGDTYVTSSTAGIPSFFDDFFSKYTYGYHIGVTNYAADRDRISVDGTNVTLTIGKLDTEHPAYSNYWNEATSVIQSLEVYCSRPAIYLDLDALDEGYDKASRIVILPQRRHSDMDLGSQTLYHQASIPMASLAEAAQTVDLTFGGNVQVTEEILDTDAGALKRYGRIISYNARFHYFDSVSHIDIGMPSFNFTSSNLGGVTHVFVRYADDDQSGLVWVGKDDDHLYGNAAVVIAPSINVKEVITYGKANNNCLVKKYRMTASTSYNYSICTDGPYYHPASQSGTIQEYEDLIPSNGKAPGITNVERDAINVTEQYNPFVFLVEHSYKAPGNVIDVQPQMAGLTDASYGRDPLSVSTERGLYNLTLGSANVLYGAFVPVSNVVAKRGGVPTEMGIFFLGDGALWLISGRRATLVSDALSEGPHKYVRGCTGYQKISGVDEVFTPSSTVSSSLYDVSDALSQVPFETFANGGRLGYNRFKMELFVSNPSYNYTYVLSLKTRQWHKLSKRVWQDEPGGILINTPAGVGTINVLDTTTETTGTVTVHLQSRPFSNGFQYTHVHRIVAMMRAKLSGTSGHIATAALYGSDNLQDWKLLAYAKRAGSTDPLYVSQLRTPSAARSWRYYTVCIGGKVQAGGDFPTDIGPVLVDHEPVKRRIG